MKKLHKFYQSKKFKEFKFKGSTKNSMRNRGCVPVHFCNLSDEKRFIGREQGQGDPSFYSLSYSNKNRLTEYRNRTLYFG